MEASQSNGEEFKLLLEKQLIQIYPSPDTQTIKTRSKVPTKAAPQSVQMIKLDAQPTERNNENVVNAFDGRKQVHTTTKWPYSVHGVVACKIENISKWGTGTMIAPHVVLTAGHNLYDYKRKAYAEVQSLQFLPGMNGHILPFGFVEIEKYFVSPNYIKEEKEDYGILILKEPVGEVTGYFGLACLEPEEIKVKRINVTGYPADKVASKPNIYEMWGMEGEAAHIDKIQGHINYLIDTAVGQSGSGVWYQEGEDYYVCGVHVFGTHFANTATMLTKAMYQQIYTWLHQVSFKELLLNLGHSKKLRFKDKKVSGESMALLRKYNLGDILCVEFLGAEIKCEGIKELAQNSFWTNLSRLYFSKNKIGAEGARVLAQNTSWMNLSRLDLSGNNIGTEAVIALAQNTSWINLSGLFLHNNNIDAEGARALAQNTSWINLSALFLSNNKIGSEGAKALSQNTFWNRLSRLELRDNNISSEGAKVLAQNTSWVNLLRLDLRSNNINGEGFKGLAQNISWVKLYHLNLSFNNLDGEGGKGLAQNTSWISLSQLILNSNNINGEGAKGLAQNISWVNLYYLDLSHNNIDGEGAKALSQNTSWSKNSCNVCLSETPISCEEAMTLNPHRTWRAVRIFIKEYRHLYRASY